jgi:RNA polymerase sigma-70 factor (ECF subfamily)
MPQFEGAYATSGGSGRVNFETTFEELYPGLFRYCHRLTGDPDLSEDVVQETFVRLYDRRVEGTDEGLRAWLFRTATHLVRDRYRVGENRRRLLEAHPVEPGGAEPPDESVERKEQVLRVREALEHLTEREREILMMRHAGFSYREIAEAVEVSATSVGTLLARAESNFASVYTESEGYEGVQRTLPQPSRREE